MVKPTVGLKKDGVTELHMTFEFQLIHKCKARHCKIKLCEVDNEPKRKTTAIPVPLLSVWKSAQFSLILQKLPQSRVMS